MHLGRISNRLWAYGLRGFLFFGNHVFFVLCFLLRFVFVALCFVFFVVALRAVSLGLTDFKAVKYLLQAGLDKIFNNFKIFQFFQN